MRDVGDRRGEEQGAGDVSPAAQPVPSRQRVAPRLRHPRPVAAPAKPAPYVHAEAKVGRNEPCPCGSGVKFKRCCGNPVAQAVAA